MPYFRDIYRIQILDFVSYTNTKEELRLQKNVENGPN